MIRKINRYAIPILVITMVVALFIVSFIIGYMHSDSYYAKQINQAIIRHDSERACELILSHPHAINAFPPSEPRFLRFLLESPAVYSPLLMAARVGDLKVVQCLLDTGADPDIQDDILFDTPLISCLSGSSEQKYDIAKLLLSYGADPLKKHINNGKYDALGAMVLGLHKDSDGMQAQAEQVFLQMLEKAKCNPMYDVCNLVAQILLVESVEMMCLLLEHYENVVQQVNAKGRTPLIEACRGLDADLKIVQLLLQYGQIFL